MRFRNNYFFLSNFYPHKIIAWGIEYPTAEHAYVASKTPNIKLRKEISQIRTPGQAKRFGRNLRLRLGWKQLKIPMMRAILRRKFFDPYLLNCLKKIDGEIIEHNPWHDNFWGACICDGCADKFKQNNLGRLLMQIRDEN
ncbi:hypothetical protein LCGC14_0869480 [marine sediment metagenome]|uniref:NADAR domain-containing protein n=1 Tax=marine sediment metagenome TaxID=412755 RepID=A0A0F9PQQ6_9ZZZZ